MENKKTIVIVSGYFNPVHSGHIDLFKSAKKLGNELVVILNNDNQVKIKGSFPFMSEKERKKVVESIKHVDSVYISIDKDGTVCKTVEKVYKDFSKRESFSFVFANGGDRKTYNVPEDKVCKKLGIEMVYNVGGGKSQSSSWLIQRTKKCNIHEKELTYCEQCFDKIGPKKKYLRVNRPWGNYVVLEEGEGYKIKRIVVNSKKRLSLQFHKLRSEHWVVVKGKAKVTVDGKERILKKGESSFVPKKSKHRLENPSKNPLEIIEVQNGSYLGEDDIVRFDDDYGRIKK